MCWYWQPPQMLKTRQRGVTRSGDACFTSTSRARANCFFTSVISASTVSPAMTNGTKTTKSFTRPTPSPPKARSRISSVTRWPTAGGGGRAAVSDMN